MIAEMVAPTAEWREPASCHRLPGHRSESPTGYSSADCSPAERFRFTGHRQCSTVPIRRLAVMPRRAGHAAASGDVISTLHTG